MSRLSAPGGVPKAAHNMYTGKYIKIYILLLALLAIGSETKGVHGCMDSHPNTYYTHRISAVLSVLW